MSQNPTCEEAADRSDLLAMSAALKARAKKRRAKKKPSKLVGSGRLVGARMALKRDCHSCGESIVIGEVIAGKPARYIDSQIPSRCPTCDAEDPIS